MRGMIMTNSCDYIDLVSPRIARLKDDLMQTSSELCFERAEILTAAYQKYESEHPVLRRAKALHDVFCQLPIFIREGELIAGQRASKLAGRSVYPEYNLSHLDPQLIPAEIRQYWQGKTISDLTHARYPETLLKAEKELACGYVTGASSGYGHVIVDYEKVINKGLVSICDEARHHLQTLDDGAADDAADNLEQKMFLESVCITLEGVMKWARRYAKLADHLADVAADGDRQKELRLIARHCRQVPAGPARTFHEALQSFWFIHIALHIEQFGWSISAGRLDQYLFPFYSSALETGDLSEPELFELLQNLWIKFMENTDTGAGHTVFQNLTLGGQDENGNDMSNRLSFLCLDVMKSLKVNQPALSVRWHPKIDPAFWTAVHQAIARGMGMPAIFNDNVIIAALEARGVSREHAYQYGIVGCVEPCIPGSQYGVTAGGHLNCAKALELALNNGQSMLTKQAIGVRTGSVSSFNTFEDLWQAYQKQVAYLLDLNLIETDINGQIQKAFGQCPLMSSLLNDCLAQKKEMNQGGARYNLSGLSVFGSSDTCDSFMSIRKWVFDHALLDLESLRQLLISDFEDHPSFRLLFANKTPRYGNDVPEADDMINRVNAVHADYLSGKYDFRGGQYTCGVWPVNGHVDSGTWTAALPDGRQSGQPLADGVGPCQGADRQGPTALLRSVSKLNNLRHWPAGNTCNIKFSAAYMKQSADIERLRDLVTTFMILGGQELQINVLDQKTLLDAMEFPEKHADLIVRVAGYSAYFTRLSRQVQQEIVSRTVQCVS